MGGYGFTAHGLVGTCSYYIQTSGSGRGGGYRNTKTYYNQTCTWDLYGNLLSVAQGAPTAPQPLSTGGGLIVPFGWEGRIRARITERVRRVFPQIGEVRFDYLWWGYVAGTADRMPHVYELAPGILSWTGCNGRGVGLAVALGREFARAFTGTPLKQIAAPVETRLRTIPGHAFRALGIAWNVAKFRRMDARD